MKKSFLFLLSLFVLNTSIYSQRDREEIDPLFNSAFKKFEEKNYSGAYVDYSAYLVKKPTDGAAY